MPSTRTFAWICGGSFALLLIIGWGGSLLEASGAVRDPGPLRLPILILMFGLVLTLAFSAIPLMVSAVLGFQQTIGNEDVLVVRTALTGRNIIIYVLWGLMALGMAIAIPAAILNGALDTVSPSANGTETLGPSQGTLVAAPGMTFADMARKSSLKIDINTRAPITSAVGAGGVFDYRIPGTGMVFHNCRYYFVSPYTHQPNRIESVNVGLSPHTVSRPEITQADVALRAKLAADGWFTGHEEYHTEEDRVLHGGAARGADGSLWLKSDMVLRIDSRRMDNPVAGEDPKTAGKWIQFVGVWPRSDYPYIERYVFAPPG
ncbi:MAG TPA: hypothetical protein VHW69_04375 [Rhizomicrobium sp.]|jgi:hypothetical protein|nr:hypothetical protein [Rhizomicrobium sp.]